MPTFDPTLIFAFRLVVIAATLLVWRWHAVARGVAFSGSAIASVVTGLSALELLFDQLPPRSSALGWVEAWRGPCVHWIATDERGAIDRVKITDPSFLNWPGLAHAVPGNIVPDFPVINKSFNLSYSGNDR